VITTIAATIHANKVSDLGMAVTAQEDELTFL
jgi:hypothetical protein